MKPLRLKGVSESERNREKFTGKKCNNKKGIKKKQMITFEVIFKFC